MNSRLRAASQAYESVKSVADLLGMTREEYLSSFLENVAPLTWTSSTTTGVV